LAPRRPGRRRRRPPQARPQLLGHDLDHLPGAAVLGGPGPLLEPATTTTRLPLLSDSATCSAWSRHTTTVKNDASRSLRPDTATRNMARAIPPSVCRSSGSSVRSPAKLTLASVMLLHSCAWPGGLPILVDRGLAAVRPPAYGGLADDPPGGQRQGGPAPARTCHGQHHPGRPRAPVS
jgi:hypothetical protein